MKKLISMVTTLFVILFANNLLCMASFKASFSILPSFNTPTKDEEFNLSLAVESSTDINVSTFRLKINFDETKLKYSGVYSNYGSDDFKTYISGGSLTIIYLTSDYGVDISANSLTSFLEVSFKTISSAPSGATSISASIDGVGNYDVKEIFSDGIYNAEINIVDEPQANCNLKSIYAQGYIITPDFNSNITQYYTTVSSTISSLDVSAVADDSSASVNVSRKKLNAAGKTTDISITVTSSDKKSKKIYKLTVLRSSSSDTSSSSSNSSKSGKNSSNSSGSLSKDSQTESSSVYNSLGSLSGLNVITSNFNFLLFFVISSICIGIVIFILRKKSK